MNARETNIEIDQYGGSKLIMPISLAIIVVCMIAYGAWSANNWASSLVTKECYEKDKTTLNETLTKLNNNVASISVTLKSKGIKIIKVED